MDQTTSYLIQLARKKMLEESTEVLEDATLITYAQFTYQDLYMRVFPNASIKTALVAFSGGVGAFPADFGTLYGNSYVNASSIFPEVSIADFQRQQLDQAITVENGTFKVYPTDTASVYVKYYPSFASISASQDPEINSYFQELIIYGIMARAYEDLQDEGLSKYYDDKYESKLALKQSVMSEYEEGNQSGGTMFNEQTLIGGNSNGSFF